MFIVFRFLKFVNKNYLQLFILSSFSLPSHHSVFPRVYLVCHHSRHHHQDQNHHSEYNEQVCWMVMGCAEDIQVHSGLLYIFFFVKHDKKEEITPQNGIVLMYFSSSHKRV